MIDGTLASVCPKCGRVKAYEYDLGEHGYSSRLKFVKNSWEGSDMFSVPGFNHIFELIIITDEVKSLIESNYVGGSFDEVSLLVLTSKSLKSSP